MSTDRCTFGAGFLRRGCRREVVSQCVYCSSPFCDEHGDDGTNVCSQEPCRENLLDTRELADWRRRVARSNRHGVCAIETCRNRMSLPCSRCQLRFCDDHLRHRRIRVRSPKSPTAQFLSALTMFIAHGQRFVMGGRFRPLGQALHPGEPRASSQRASFICTHCDERRQTPPERPQDSPFVR